MTITTLFSLIIIMVPFVIVFLFRRFFLNKKDVPGELFTEALRNENSGYFETAIMKYERALDEVNKNKFQDNSLKSKIIEKLKVLNTVIEYKKGFHLGR